MPILVAKYMFCKEVPDAYIASIQKIAAANVHKIIINLRSLLSEKKPMGHWKNPPAQDIKNINIKISKLAQGLPVGGEIESLDDGTLISAFKNRKGLNSESDWFFYQSIKMKQRLSVARWLILSMEN